MVSFEEEDALTAKIIDLGLAKTVGEPGSQTAISMPGGFAGTPAFASPEQFAGVGVDIRSDLYSLGAVLWKTVIGETVFTGSRAELMYQHQHAPLPLEKLEGVPQPVIVLLEVLLDHQMANPKFVGRSFGGASRGIATAAGRTQRRFTRARSPPGCCAPYIGPGQQEPRPKRRRRARRASLAEG
jgi:serine/threonine protein kinase